MPVSVYNPNTSTRVAMRNVAGRIVSRRHSLGDPSNPSQSSQKFYAYDVMDRLVSDGGVAYAYDAAGNRMTKTENGETITYTLGVGDRLASYGRAASPPGRRWRRVYIRHCWLRHAHGARRQSDARSRVERTVPARVGLDQRRFRGGLCIRRLGQRR